MASHWRGRDNEYKEDTTEGSEKYNPLDLDDKLITYCTRKSNIKIVLNEPSPPLNPYNKLGTLNTSLSLLSQIRRWKFTGALWVCWKFKVTNGHDLRISCYVFQQNRHLILFWVVTTILLPMLISQSALPYLPTLNIYISLLHFATD